MEAEVSQQLGAEKSGRAKSRSGYRCGSRPRRLETRMGTMYLMVPKVRQGGYISFFVTERKRSEAALIQVVQEAFVQGVSTRKMEKLARRLGIENLSRSQVSEMTKGLNEQVEAFHSRPLSESLYPVLWVDVVISDAHSGLVAAIRKGFPGASWQRCKVHFMRNILAHVPHKEKEAFAQQLKTIWLAPTREQACSQAEALCRLYERRFPKAIRRLEDGLEDSLAFYAFPQLDARKISSTNLLERLNREIRRRTSAVGSFPIRIRTPGW